ncbi:hypothetical protein FRB99_001872, partial [Tulasnella sp. 403]
SATITPQGDVYAFGFTVYEVLNNKFPFGYGTIARAMFLAAQGERPHKKPVVSPHGDPYTDVWAVAEACWRHEPSDRITAEEAMTRLEEARGPLDENIHLRGVIDRPIVRGANQVPLQHPEHHPIHPGSPSTRDRKPHTPGQGRQVGWRSLVRKLTNLLRAVRAFRVPISPATRHHEELKLTENPILWSAVEGVVNLGEDIKFDSSSLVPHAIGGSGEIYKAVLQKNRMMIAIKVLRPANAGDSDLGVDAVLARRLGRELSVWKALKHDRITPLLGFAILPRGPCLVSPWCANGNALEYSKKCSRANRRQLILQIAEGLVFLHTHDPIIIHGDIKARNVLINDDGEAMLCDFGLAKFFGVASSGFTTSDQQKGTVRWMAPEQFQEDGKPVYTIESDVYAFGCLILGAMPSFPIRVATKPPSAVEIMTGKAPFIKYVADFAAVTAKSRGEFMEPTDYLELPEDDPLWPLLRNCWAMEPENRPLMVDLRRELSRL